MEYVSGSPGGRGLELLEGLRPHRRCAIAESERFWEQVLQRLEDGTVVPVVGPELLTVPYRGGETLLYPLVAARLAQRLGVSPDELPGGAELPEVARRHLLASQEVQEIYRSVRAVFRDLDPIPVPAPLVQLARISRIQLYVTTTFDALVERAVDHVRFEGQRQTLGFAYSPSDRQDLPPEFDRLGRPAVFYLMGRLSGTPHSYAVTREDTLEFLRSLQSKAGSPSFLFDKLRRSDVLVIGTRFAEWLSHRFADSGEVSEATKASSVLFLRRGGGTKVWQEGGVEDFVNELYRRWCELQPDEVPEPPPPLRQLATAPGMQPGAVFLSCAREDRGAAESIREALDRAGVDVVLDEDDVPLPERWEQKLRSFVGECSLFVPVVSSRSSAAERRYRRREWVEAIIEARNAAPCGRFVLPVCIDDCSPEQTAVAAELGELPWEILPQGRAGSEFVRKVVELQRSYRSARLA